MERKVLKGREKLSGTKMMKDLKVKKREKQGRQLLTALKERTMGRQVRKKVKGEERTKTGRRKKWRKKTKAQGKERKKVMEC